MVWLESVGSNSFDGSCKGRGLARDSTVETFDPWLGEAGDETVLPGRLHSVGRVVLADVRDRLPVGHSIEHCDAGQGGAGAPLAAAARDFDALVIGARPGFAQRGCGSCAVGRRPEVRPAKPAGLPRHGGRLVTEQIQREGGKRTRGKRPA